MLRLGYSGVHGGWGWRLAQGYSRRNEIAFNRIRRHIKPPGSKTPKSSFLGRIAKIVITLSLFTFRG